MKQPTKRTDLKNVVFSDFKVANYVSLINRDLEFYFNHYADIKDSLDISRMEGVYLMILENNPSISQNEISKLLKADATLVSKFTNSLINKGYIYTEKAPEDKRKKLLYLTDSAKNILPEFTKACHHFNKTVFKNFDEKSYQDLENLLDKFFHNIQTFKTIRK